MKIFIKVKVLPLISLFIAFAILMSCQDDNTTASSQVELLSFGPSGVHHGDQISFIGNNLNAVTAIELPGISVPSSEFIDQTSEMIVIVVPPQAEEGVVTLKTPTGDIVSKTVLSFEVPISIVSMTAEVRPGDNVTINGDFLNWVTEVWFSDDLVVTEFESQSLNELVVKVPKEAQTGPIVLIGGGTDPMTIESEEELIVTLPLVTGLTPNPVARESDLKITGTNLDLTMGVLFKGLTAPVTEFVSISSSELVLTVPAEVNKGAITLIAYSGIQVVSAEALNIEGDLPALAPLSYAFYIDAIENGWGSWGWGGPVDFANSDNVRDGDKAIKKTFDGSWDALKFGGGSVSTASYTEITFSIFGAPGTDGLKLNASASGGGAFVITIVEGEWTEYKLTKADFGNPEPITDLQFQAQGWSGVLFFDHIGLR